jgi:hypothetical protein
MILAPVLFQRLITPALKAAVFYVLNAIFLFLFEGIVVENPK